jgi:hypothetical protein
VRKPAIFFAFNRNKMEKIIVLKKIAIDAVEKAVFLSSFLVPNRNKAVSIR